jgi:hypothetical protein
VNDAIVRGAKLPLEYMLQVIEDETATQTRRDQMAIAAAPFCHPRLSAVTTSNTNVNHKGDDNPTGIVNIFAVPRGAHITHDGTGVTIDGQAIELQPFEPYKGTPPLGLSDQSEPSAEPSFERLEVNEIDTSNVTPLRPRDHTDEDSEPPGAA